MWPSFGACHGQDVNRWFTDAADAVAAAVDCCQRCPVLDPCRDDALAAEHGLPLKMRHGIRGAMTPAERVRVRA